jgi:hypothetical protein
MVTISYVLATGLSLIVITWCMLFVVTAYTRAVVRDAASRATRDGAASYNVTKDNTAAINACTDRFSADLGAGLPAGTVLDCLEAVRLLAESCGSNNWFFTKYWRHLRHSD